MRAKGNCLPFALLFTDPSLLNYFMKKGQVIRRQEESHFGQNKMRPAGLYLEINSFLPIERTGFSLTG